MKIFVAVALVMVMAAPPATPSETRTKVGRATLSFYWVVEESASRYSGEQTATLRDRRGKVIAQTTPRFRRDLVMEGTGWLRDGRTVAYAGKVRGEHRFRVLKKHRYGLTANGCPATPYRTAAVDPKFVKLGSKIYIPQLKGAKLPDGSEHDGVFIATDRGQFRGSHVDVFVGVGAKSTRPFTRKGYPSRSRVTVYLEDASIERCRG